jgi:hypothetical protein
MSAPSNDPIGPQPTELFGFDADLGEHARVVGAGLG